MPTTFANAAEMQDRLGGVPLERIRMTPAPGTATVDDLERCQAACDVTLELVDGTLVEKAMGTWESRVAGRLGFSIERFLEQHDLGLVFAGDGQLRMQIDLIRAPALSFVSWEQFPDQRLPRDEYWPVHPDLAVEVLSRSNTSAEIDRKTREYVEAGAKLVWVVDPANGQATIHRPTGEPVQIDESGSLDGRDLLPGFTIRLGDLFDQAAGRGKRPN